MMSAQMLAAATNNAETVVASQDSMKLLEAEAEQSRASAPPVTSYSIILLVFRID